MPIWFFPALLALSAVVSIAAGIWLLLHAQAVAVLFRDRGDVVPGPSRSRASRRSVILALILFNLGWVASVAIWSYAISGQANEVIDQKRVE